MEGGVLFVVFSVKAETKENLDGSGRSRSGIDACRCGYSV